jgi:hypothetical protein
MNVTIKKEFVKNLNVLLDLSEKENVDNQHMELQK